MEMSKMDESGLDGLFRYADKKAKELVVLKSTRNAWVDEGDFELLNQFKWHLESNDKSNSRIGTKINSKKLKELGIEWNKVINVTLPNIIYYGHLKNGTVIDGILQGRNLRMGYYDGDVYNNRLDNLAPKGQVLEFKKEDEKDIGPTTTLEKVAIVRDVPKRPKVRRLPIGHYKDQLKQLENRNANMIWKIEQNDRVIEDLKRIIKELEL
jgi:hypothetical protein